MADVMMRVPEYIILNHIEAALKIVRDDFVNQVNEQDTILWKMFQGTIFQRYDFFEQAKQVICGDIDDPRRVECNLIFNMKRGGAPTVHLNLPGEVTDNDNGIGIDEGYQTPIYVDGDPGSSTGTFTSVFTRSQSATYNIVITTDNSNEIVLLYHFIRALLISCYNSLSLHGLKNIKFGGQDIQPYSDLIPANLWLRGISMSFSYETSSFDFTSQVMINGIGFQGILKSEIQ